MNRPFSKIGISLRIDQQETGLRMKMNLPEERFKSWIPFGFEFLGPSETEDLSRQTERIRTVFKTRGYQEVTPPALDYAATFRLARSGQTDESFETRDRMGEALALRSDLTVQVIKAAAAGRFSASGGFSYVQSVFVDHPFGSGLPRQTLQAGVELLGSRKDRLQELIDLAGEIVPGAKILYGDMRFLGALGGHTTPAILRAVDRKDPALRELLKTSAIPAEKQRILLELPFLSGASLAEYQSLVRGFDDLTKILDEAPNAECLVYDFGLVRDLSYYTGPVFQGYVAGEQEAVVSGGVYDELFGLFGSKPCNACGMAFNVSLLARIKPKI